MTSFEAPEPAVITPTVGRIVHYYEPSPVIEPPRAAIVAFVHNDRLVNLSVIEVDGTHTPRQNVRLVQPADPPEDKPMDVDYCQWMPYQIKKGHGSESGERAAGVEEITPAEPESSTEPSSVGASAPARPGVDDAAAAPEPDVPGDDSKPPGEYGGEGVDW